MNCWNRLGISETENKRDIKRAYARLLKKCPPEDDPEGFQRLNQAYNEALNWYFEPEVDWQESEQEERSDSSVPSINEADKDNKEETLPEPLGRDVTANSETAEQEQSTDSIAQDEEQQLFNDIESFLDNFLRTLQEPSTRKDTKAWYPLLENENLTSFAFKQAVSFRVFDYLAQFYTSDIAIKDGAFVPKNIVRGFSEVLDWPSDELELIKHFSTEEVSLVMKQAYGKAAVASEEEEPKTWKQNLSTVFVWIFLINMLFRGFNYLLDVKDESKAPDNQPTPLFQAQWDDSLLVCQSLTTPEESTSFNQCLKLAEDGWIRAQKKIAWLYSVENENKSMQSTYNWLLKAGENDDNAKLLSYIVLFEEGSTEKDKQRGERGLIAMASQNIPAAKAYLASIYFLKTNTLPVINEEYATLLEEAYNQSQIFVDTLDLASVYFNGFGIEKDRHKARDIIEEGAHRDFPTSTNNVAWFVATMDDTQLFEPAFAVELAESVVSDSAYENHVLYTDTLAAAYAAADRYEEAQETQSHAIQILNSLAIEESEKAPYMKDFIRREQLYRSRQREISSTLNTEQEVLFNKIRKRIGILLFNDLYDATDNSN